MSERDRLLSALKNASKAAESGDQQAAKDAKALANQLKTMQRNPDRGFFDETMRGIGSGLSNLVGLVPGAAMELGNLTGVTDFENTSGSDLIKRGLGPLGVTHLEGERVDDSYTGAAAELVGENLIPGVGGAAALLNRGLGPVTRTASGVVQRGRDVVAAPSATANVPASISTRAPSTATSSVPARGRIDDLLDTAATTVARNPKLTGAAEVTGAAGAGIGMKMGRDNEGEGSLEEGLGALVGGISGSMAPAALGKGVPSAIGSLMDVTPVSRAIKNKALNFLKLEDKSSTNRAVKDRLQEVTDLRGRLDSDDPAVAAEAEEQLATMQRSLRGEDPDVMPDLLTPAQRTDSSGILSLAAKARSDNPQLMAHWQTQSRENLDTLRQRIQSLGADAGDDLTTLSKVAQDDLDGMVSAAGMNAQRKIASFRGDDALSRSDAGVVMRNELEDAYRGARATERTLWGKVPEDMVMPAESARERYLTLRDQLGEITSSDMPNVARRYMDPDSPQTWMPPAENGIQDTVSLKRLQELRSALLDETAEAMSGTNPNRNRARLARQLADGIREDLEAVDPRESPGTAAFTAARDYSRKLNDRFTRGPVGDVLRMKPNREAVIPDEETFSRTVGQGGIKAKRAVRAFTRALRSPSEASKGAYRDYLDDEFMTKAFRADMEGNPTLNQSGAESFMAKYRDVFEGDPQLARKYQEMIDTGNFDRAARMASDGVANVLSKGNPAAEVRRIKKMTNTEGGEPVWENFRRNMLSEITKSATRVRDGQEGFSGQAILSRLDNDPKFSRAIEETFSEGEIRRLRQIANTAARIERDMGSPAAADLTKAKPSLLTNIVSQVSGARTGSAVDNALSGGSAGTSLQSARLGSNILKDLAQRGVRDPQANLILDALDNPDAMQALLIPPRNDAMARRFANVINAWAVHTLDKEDMQAMDIGQVPSLDTYIENALNGSKEGRPTATDLREMRDQERRDRLQPAAGLPRQESRMPDPYIRGGSREGGRLSEILGQ